MDDYLVLQCESAMLLDVVTDCLWEVIGANLEQRNKFSLPVELELAYSQRGGMGLAIGRYWIVCETNPPDKEGVKKLLRRAYDSIFSGIKHCPIRIGRITELNVPDPEVQRTRMLIEILTIH